ncbi:MAG TPA: hypothetical protein VGQ69_10560 [Gemmatimonadales bacterium]|jgi:hypothetical protein|nr:hypothetical protein [Gemmatimonadales bacterium]
MIGRALRGLANPIAGCAALATCAPPAEREVEFPIWRVASSPWLSIGTSEADPGHELSDVSGARLLAGVVVIANSGSLELRAFDSTGKYLGATGRSGQGPGDFANRIYIFPAPGDSLYVFDEGNLRWSLHSARGDYARVLSGGAAALPRPTWLYRRTIVESNTPGPVPAWALGVLRMLPELPSSAPVRWARFDDLGFLWLAESPGAKLWTIFADSTTRVASVSLPTGFSLMQAGSDFVLGIERDSMEQEIVRAYALDRQRRAQAAVGPEARPAPRDSALEQRMLSDVPRVLMAQELFYSQHASYTSQPDSLRAPLESGAELVLLYGNKRHWAGILFDRKTKTTCGVSVGSPAPPGWIDGLPFCGR